MLGSRFEVGVKVAVFVAATYVTDPATTAPPTPATANVNVPGAITVTGFIAWLNVAAIFWFVGTTTAPFSGFIETTAGIVPVVKVQTKFAVRPIPVEFFAPIVIVAVYSVLGRRAAFGVNVAVVPENVIVPVTGVTPGPVTVKVAAFIVVAFIG